MLKVKDLHFRYGSAPVLRGASLELKQGEVGILLGKNGSGKTTMFKNILGIEKPKSGEITFGGESLLKMNRRDRARRIAYVPQHIHFGDLSVFDSVLMGRVSYFGMKASREDYQVVENILRDMQLLTFANRSAEALSGGEKQKIAIARAMAQEARKLARQKNISVLSSLHDLNQALSFGDKFFFLVDGVVKYTGGREIVTPEILKDTFDVDLRIREIDGQTVVLQGLR